LSLRTTAIGKVSPIEWPPSLVSFLMWLFSILLVDINLRKSLLKILRKFQKQSK